MTKRRAQPTNEPLGPENAAQRRDIEQTYIDIGDLPAVSSLPENVGDVRVLIGRKGTGKTHMLRHIQLSSQAAGYHVSYEELDEAFIANSGMVQLRGSGDAATAVLLWTDCWRYAIIAAAFSHFTCNKAEERALASLSRASTSQEQVRADYRDFAFSSQYPLGPYAVLKRFFDRYKSVASIKELFGRLDFREAEYELGKLLHGYGDVHYLIDGIDEFAWTDPRMWLEPQIGLLKLCFLQKVTQSGARSVYVTAAFRNYVFSHVLKDSQADRIRIGAGVVPLNWTAAAATAFMNTRLRQVRTKTFARSERLTGDRPLANWLGFGSFTPYSRGRTESVEDYLLRHTRCSPRHVIEMFTLLCTRQNELAKTGRHLDEEGFETIVKEQARSIAEVTLQNAAEELLSYVRLDRKVAASVNLVKHAQNYYCDAMVRALRAAIMHCRVEVVPRRSLRDAIEASLAEVVDKADAAIMVDLTEDTLWRSGVIGYQAEEGGRGVWRYTWSDHEFGVGQMPAVAERIGFHPSFVTSCKLEVSPDGPVF